MIKTLTLLLTIHNPMTDVDSVVAYDTYSYDECFKEETKINKTYSILNQSLKEFKLELVETRCD
jgi:hypothetical protein